MSTNYVSSGQVPNGLTASLGNDITVLAGGSATTTTVLSGGQQSVYGNAVLTVVSLGGVEAVYAGGYSLSATIADGGSQVVSSGSLAGGTIVSSGGRQIVSSGGVAEVAVIDNGGQQVVSASGITTSTAVDSGGQQTISSGGTASGTIIAALGLQVVMAGGTASASLVNSGGAMLVSGIARAATVSSGGTATVFGGGTAIGTLLLSGSRQTVSSGGIASFTTAGAGAELLVAAGGVASAGTMSGGGTTVLSGGIARGMTVMAQGAQFISAGGVASATLLTDDGRQHVRGIASGTVITNLSLQIVHSGGVAIANVVRSDTDAGAQIVAFGGATSGTQLLSGGAQLVTSGGLASGTVVSSGGRQVVGSGGVVSGTLLRRGGLIDLNDLAFAADATATFDSVTGALTVTEGAASRAVQFAGTYTGSRFALTADSADGSTLVTLVDDTVMSIAALDADKAEGTGGATPFTFTIARVGNNTGASSVLWAVTGSGANPAVAADFAGGVLPSGTVDFAAGEASKILTLSVAADSLFEPDEGFTVTLAAVANAVLGTTTAAGTIRNDDAAPPPTLAIAALAADRNEGNSGTTPFTFTVTRSGDTTGSISVAYSVAGSGLRPASASDFAGAVLPSGSVSFAAGDTTAIITIPVAGDLSVEPDETFTVTLASPSPQTAITIASAVGTIRADDTIVDLSVFNGSTGLPMATAPTFYTGPVVGVEKEFILLTPDNLNIAAADDNWFIHSGSGTDGLAAHGGRNVLDGGTGSNFLTGAGGEDTFFVDTRGATSDVWSTVVGFGVGDSATVWGVSEATFTIVWLDNLGAEGFKGLTMLASAPGKPNALITLAGYSQADMNNGRLLIVLGQIDASSPYLYVFAAA